MSKGNDHHAWMNDCNRTINQQLGPPQPIKIVVFFLSKGKSIVMCVMELGE